MPGLGPSESFHLPCSPGTMNSGGQLGVPKELLVRLFHLKPGLSAPLALRQAICRDRPGLPSPPPQLLVPIPWWDPEMWAAKKLGFYLLYSNQVSFKSLTLHLNTLLV